MYLCMCLKVSVNYSQTVRDFLLSCDQYIAIYIKKNINSKPPWGHFQIDTMKRAD